MDVLWLGHADCHDVNRAGAKAAYLSRLASCYRVPRGFCITPEAYSRWTELIDNGRSGSISPAIPPDLSDALTSVYRDLSDTCGVAEPRVAVRSSAVDEDGATHSFAGQHETSLNIVGARAVAEAVIRCWTSVGAARALSYRQRQGLAVAGTHLAVLVQQLVPADASAVVFSANPVTGRGDEVMINASWGLGESLVGGTVNPDTYVVRKPNLAIASRDIAEKRRMTVPARQGTHEVPVPRRFQKSPTIDDSQVAELARLSMALETAMGWPVDIECAYRGRDLYLLQCRPITTLSAF